MLAETLPAPIQTVGQRGLPFRADAANSPILRAGDFGFLADDRGTFAIPEDLTIACPAVTTPHTAPVLHIDLTALDIVVELAARPAVMRTDIGMRLL